MMPYTADSTADTSIAAAAAAAAAALK